jgi:large subunit ribosomal protein L3e
MSSAPAKKTYAGGCHCGAIRYEVSFDTSAPMVTRCNCSICHKKGYLSLKLPLASDLKLLSPITASSFPKPTELTLVPPMGDYQFGGKSVHHYFCTTCGVHCFLRVDYTGEDGSEQMHLTLNALTLDQGQEGLDLREWKVKYVNKGGAEWAMGDEPFEGGVW